MNQHAYFITGTDTSVGKTFMACTLLRHWRRQGYTTAALKPVATGAHQCNGQWHNDDALALQQACSMPLPYAAVNPYCFALPGSPHAVAAEQGVHLTVPALLAACQPVLQSGADRIVVEGAGGWYTPLNATDTLADLAQQLALPIILVVGMRLGCLNHARLSYEAIRSSGLPIAGWIASVLTPDMLYVSDNIRYLRQHLPMPLLAEIPFLYDLDGVDEYPIDC